MKIIGRRAFVTLASASALVLAGCSSEEEEEEVVIPDLTGQWAQTNSGSEDSYMIATIVGSVIKVYWYSIDEEGSETTSLYWAGTYVAPESDEAYSWESENDHDQTDYALLASSADTKEFAYEDGVLSFEVTALGTTTTVTMEKTSDEVDELEAAAAAEDPVTAEIVESGYYLDDGDTVLYGIGLENPNSAYAIEYLALYITGRTEDGSIAFSDSDTIDYLRPGETLYLAGVSSSDMQVATVEFSVEEDPSFTASDEEVVDYYTIANTSVVETTYGLTFTGEITTEYDPDDSSAAYAYIILRDDSGAIVYGNYDFIDVPSVGSTLAFEISTWTTPPAYATYEIHAYPAY